MKRVNILSALLCCFLSGLAIPPSHAQGVLSSINVTPDNPTMYVGQSITFTAQGYDAAGNPCPINDPRWSANTQYGYANVDPDNPLKCTFTATKAGTGGIACGEGGFTGVVGSTNIYIVGGGQLSRIDVTPSSANLSVGQQQQFSATGYDANNNQVPITPVWTTSGGTITSGGLYTATVVGDFTVTASVEGSPITGTATAHVTPGQLARIDVTPSSANLSVGQQQQFSATGYDANNNQVPITPVWTTSGGTITSGGLYTATQVGDFTVTASVEGSPVIGIAKVHVGPDNDGDGITDHTENGAPNNGDGNGDGIPDGQQPNVTSLPSATRLGEAQSRSQTGQGYITVVTSCTQNQEVWAYTEPQASQGVSDPDCGYRYGLVGFKLHCTNATVKVFFHGAANLAGFAFRKYGPTPPNFDNPQWYYFSNVTFGTITIAGHSVAYAQFTLTDGQLGDDTVVDGWIVDQGGPAHAGSDFNMDLVVDFIDMEFLFGQWLSSRGSGADLDDSGEVDNFDFALFSRDWLWQY